MKSLALAPLFALMVALALVAPGGAAAQTLCPDGGYVDSGPCQIFPDGTYVSGTTCVIAPDGSYVGSD